MRRTNSTWLIHVTRSTASTSCPALATSEWNWTATCSPSHRGPRCCLRPCCPPRYYLPPGDIRAELTPSGTRIFCAYKGQASYWSAASGGRTVPDIDWTYQQPQHDAAQVRGLIAFFNERLDLIVDGERLERPITPWSAKPGA